MDRKKEARGKAFKGKRFRRKKLDPEKPKEVGRAKQTEAWILTLPKEQTSNQTRRQEKLGASQDESKLSHSNDWCTKTGPNTTPPNEDDTYPSKAQYPSLAEKKPHEKPFEKRV